MMLAVSEHLVQLIEPSIKARLGVNPPVKKIHVYHHQVLKRDQEFVEFRWDSSPFIHPSYFLISYRWRYQAISYWLPIKTSPVQLLDYHT
jgi:hypothetical protein